jgi:hypothetical protein
MTTIKITQADGNEVNLTGYDAHERSTSLKNLLKGHVCEVTFTKVDGTVRVMPCTLKEDVLPAAAPRSDENTKVRRFNEENLSVWDMDKAEWRSFKTANVTEVKVLS